MAWSSHGGRARHGFSTESVLRITLSSHRNNARKDSLRQTGNNRTDPAAVSLRRARHGIFAAALPFRRISVPLRGRPIAVWHRIRRPDVSVLPRGLPLPEGRGDGKDFLWIARCVKKSFPP